jgi:hypothetical protein
MPHVIRPVIVILTLTNAFDFREETLTADQFVRLMRANFASISDIAFAFEGRRQYVNPARVKDIPDETFQGRYALRADGAMYREVYSPAHGGRPDAIAINAMVKGKGQRAVIRPDMGNTDLKVLEESAGPGSYFTALSPETFQMLWRFLPLGSANDMGYQFLGWENIDGHRCAHIYYDPHPSVSRPVSMELWIDIERGAIPLRIKNSHGHQPTYVVDKIKLERIGLEDGIGLWLPVRGIYREYHDQGEYTDKPSYETECYVLSDTIVLNQGLQDEVFNAKGQPFRPDFRLPEPKPAPAAKPRLPLDVTEAERRLDAKLAEARPGRDRPDAAAALRAESEATAWLPWTVGLGGLAVLLAAAWLARRH